MNVVTSKYWQGYFRLSIREAIMLQTFIMTVPLLLTHLLYRKVLAKKFTTKLDHLPHLTNLVPCYFWLLPKLKTALKGHIFFGPYRHSLGTCSA
jgi:hypothetical protein